MTTFLEMYRAVTPLIQAGILRIEHQFTHSQRSMIVASDDSGVRLMLNAEPNIISVFICAGQDDTLPWYELKSVLRAVGSRRPDWIVEPLPDEDDIGWVSATEIGDCLTRNWPAFKRLGEPDGLSLEGLQSEYVEWRPEEVKDALRKRS